MAIDQTRREPRIKPRIPRDDPGWESYDAYVGKQEKRDHRVDCSHANVTKRDLLRAIFRNRAFNFITEASTQ
jgi:hypothetical protein